MEHLLPSSFAGSPGTGLIVVLLVLYYALMVMLAGVDSLLGFSSFSLQQLGATHGPSIIRGQFWRVVTANFLHHDLAHLGLNVWALMYVGPLVEEVFDRKKMILIFIVSGIASMIASHVYYTMLSEGLLVTSGGASGAVSGLIGAAFFVAWRMGPPGRSVFEGLRRWIIFMAIMGFFMNVNNAAHLGGFVVGIGCTFLVPLGLTQSVVGQKFLSAFVLCLFALVLWCCVLMLQNLRGFPAHLDADYFGRSVLFVDYAEGHPWDYSSQVMLQQACLDAIDNKEDLTKKIKRCDLNLRANPRNPSAYVLLALLYEEVGRIEEAKRLRVLALRLGYGRAQG